MQSLNIKQILVDNRTMNKGIALSIFSQLHSKRNVNFIEIYMPLRDQLDEQREMHE